MSVAPKFGDGGVTTGILFLCRPYCLQKAEGDGMVCVNKSISPVSTKQREARSFR